MDIQVGGRFNRFLGLLVLLDGHLASHILPPRSSD